MDRQVRVLLLVVLLVPPGVAPLSVVPLAEPHALFPVRPRTSLPLSLSVTHLRVGSIVTIKLGRK